MKKIFVGTLVLIFGLYFLSQMDDSLSAESQALLNKATATQNLAPSEAYFYLMGIYAGPNDDPVALGKARFENIQQAQTNQPNPHLEFNYTEIEPEDELVLAQDNLSCRIWEEACFDLLFSDEYDRATLLAEQATLLQRYQTFLTLSDYRTLTRPHANEPLPPYQYLSWGNRLLGLHALELSHQGDTQQAIELLTTSIQQLRKQLTNADTLIGKMMFTILVSENLDLLSVLAEETGQSQAIQFEELSLAERSVESAMAREFWMMSEMYKHFDHHPEFLDEDSNAPAWLIRILFKPNMSLNALYPAYERPINESHGSAREFSDSVADTENIELEKSYLRNSVGSILNGVALMQYRDYVGRIFDLNAKLYLLNESFRLGKTPEQVQQFVNPYSGNDRAAFFSPDRKSICLPGPLKDTRNLRCLRTER